MPRDKTDTHNKLLPCIKQEFLEHGYEKASMQNIARRAGITAAGIYRHFPSKEAMFTAMVEPVTSDFLKMCDVSMEETYSRLSDDDFLKNFNEFRTGKTGNLLTLCMTIMMFFDYYLFVQKVHLMNLFRSVLWKSKCKELLICLAYLKSEGFLIKQ